MRTASLPSNLLLVLLFENLMTRAMRQSLQLLMPNFSKP